MAERDIEQLLREYAARGRRDVPPHDLEHGILKVIAGAGGSQRRMSLRRELLLSGAILLSVAAIAIGIARFRHPVQVIPPITATASASPTINPTPTLTPTPSSTVQPSPTVSPGGIDTSGWPTYTSSSWHYVIKYPGTWYDEGISGTEKWFSNEHVGAPLQMDQKGIWLTISVGTTSPAKCGIPPTGSTQIISARPVVIAGIPTIEYEFKQAPPGAEYSAGLLAGVVHQGQCYSFDFATMTKDTSVIDSNLGVLNAILGTVRFTG
jgi:hypothetical protein